MNYVMLPAYISMDLNFRIMNWLNALPEGSWQCNTKVGDPAKFEFTEGEAATLFTLKFGHEFTK